MLSYIFNSLMLVFPVGHSYGLLAEVNKRNPDAQKVLRLARHCGNPNIRNSSNMPVLQLVAETGNLDAVQALLDRGADINAKDQLDHTALSTAVEGNHTALALSLLARGANPNIAARNAFGGLFPLEAAIARNNAAVVNALLDHGADIEQENDLQGRPLMAAARHGNCAMAELLLARGANVNAVSAQSVNGTALIAALSNKNDCLPMLRTLLAAGADPNLLPPGKSHTLLHIAVHKHPSAVDVLLAAGCNANMASPLDGITALMSAAMSGDERLVDLLIKNGADVNAVDHDGRNALVWAAKCKHAGLVAKLCQNGASLGSTIDALQARADAKTVEDITLLRGYQALVQTAGKTGPRPAPGQ